MADDELVAQIRRWNASTSDKTKVLVGADLSRASLGGVNLSGADLSKADLNGADLTGANLEGAKLAPADLVSANLTEANLTGADLSGAILVTTNFELANLNGANLSYSSLYRTNFADSELVGANLQGARLDKTLFVNCNLSGVEGLKSVNHVGPCAIDHGTIQRSGGLPDVFLRGCGLPDSLIEYFPSLLNQPISFYSCFISYSHADSSFARRLHDALQGRGIRCWLDEHQLLPGDDIYKEVDRGLRLWDKVLLCASESSLKSWWVDNEINSAFKKEQKLMRARGKKIYALIPLNLDGAIFENDWGDGKAEQIRSRLAADFTGWEADNSKFETVFEFVVKALMEDGGREKPPEPKL